MTDTWQIILIVFLAGCLGGLTNAAIAGELHLPEQDREAKVFRPGWIGNVLVGGVAGLVFWGVYGPMANAIVIGPLGVQPAPVVLHVSELFGALLTGVGGGRLLTSAIDKQVSDREKLALTEAKDALAQAVTSLVQEIRP